jgi:hypothetical protein
MYFSDQNNTHLVPQKAFNENIIKLKPEGTSMVFNGELDGMELIPIDSKYSKLYELCFIMSDNVGFICDGDPYQMKFLMSMVKH